MSSHIMNVAIVGAGGRSGGFIVNALVSQGMHKVTAITRPDSTNELPKGLHDVKKVDYGDHAALVEALKGQDFLIITLNATAPPDSQTKLVDAAAEAGIKWIMPNEWGGDYSNEQFSKDILLGERARAIRQHIEKAGLTWTAISCGFWYEFSLSGAELRYGFDFKEKRFTIFDDGKQKISTTTWPQVGRTVAKLLALPIEGSSPCLSDYKNKPVFIQSFHINQLDMFESVKRVTGTKETDWTIGHEGTQERFQRGKELFKGGDWKGFGLFLYTRAFFPDGISDFSDRLENGKLDLSEEDLDEYTRVAVGYVESGEAAKWS